MSLQILLGPAFIAAALVAVLGAYSQYIVQRAGIFSTSPVAFIAVGAYASAFTLTQTDLPVAAAIAIAVLLSAAGGAVLGLLVSRLRGAYVAIATLSVVLVFQQLATIWTPVTGGPLGISSIPVWASVPVLWALVAVVVVGVLLMELSAAGRRQAALRMDEVAAASLGTNVTANGVIAMTVSSALAGLGGAALAGNQYAIDPTAFGFAMVVSMLSAVVIGGYRSLLGPVLGGFVVIALPLVLSGYALLAGIIVGLTTILILRFFPRGIAGLIPFSSEMVARLFTRRVAAAPAEAMAPWTETTGPQQLEAQHIARSYGAVRAVADVSLTVPRGRIVGLIGPNGAGKTSVINLLAGVTKLHSGTVLLGDTQIQRLPSYRIARLGVARTFQACRLFREMSVLDNVRLGAASTGSRGPRDRVSHAAAARWALGIVGYEGNVDRPAGELPYADQRRVEIARALATRPGFLLLDEPAAGMTGAEADALGEVLRRIGDLGIGILVVDHNVSWIFSICEHVTVQSLGAVIAAGEPEEVRRHPEVIEAYIGTSGSHAHAEG